MPDIKDRLESILPRVRMPAQYVGCEVNSVKKDPADVAVSFCLAFPDSYSIGMSHVGLKILYDVLNTAPRYAAERAFCPLPDMEAAMRESGVPLYALESLRPASSFDVLGFTLEYELTYSNVLRMIDLAGVPVVAAERGEGHPLVIAGGLGAFSPEPLADFIDAFVLGDGEEVILEIAASLERTRGVRREERLLALAREVAGVYVPGLYDVRYNVDGTVAEVAPKVDGVPPRVERRIVSDLDATPYPTAMVVPFVETVHDRYSIEIMRGCVHGCRFCQAGVLYRPRRERSVETVLRLAKEGVRRTGYDEVGLASLSSGDYSKLGELMSALSAELGPSGVSLSLPSLHVGKTLKEIPPGISSVRKSGLTVAPECATDRLRRAIRKNIANADLYDGMRAAFASGWETVKLYFMIGLPGEREEDVHSIASMADEVSFLRKRAGKSPAKVNVSISSFVPKAHTPFQWEPMLSREDILARQAAVRGRIRSSKVRASFHEIEASLLEGVFSRGDRRLGRALLEATRRGAKFDAWSEHFDPAVWREAFAATGTDSAFYAHRRRGHDEVLPWAHLDAGVDPARLARERDDARRTLEEQ